MERDNLFCTGLLLKKKCNFTSAELKYKFYFVLKFACDDPTMWSCSDVVLNDFVVTLSDSRGGGDNCLSLYSVWLAL
jgi:hypothetical protein